jgi:hypothetical protein
MNILELAKQAGFQDADWNYNKGLEKALKQFADLVTAQEREAWEQKFARLQNLMDVQEIQPNKPCCLAARADEREACARVLEKISNAPDIQLFAAAIRARGTT